MSGVSRIIVAATHLVSGAISLAINGRSVEVRTGEETDLAPEYIELLEQAGHKVEVVGKGKAADAVHAEPAPDTRHNDAIVAAQAGALAPDQVAALKPPVVAADPAATGPAPSTEAGDGKGDGTGGVDPHPPIGSVAESEGAVQGSDGHGGRVDETGDKAKHDADVAANEADTKAADARAEKARADTAKARVTAKADGKAKGKATASDKGIDPNPPANSGTSA